MSSSFNLAKKLQPARKAWRSFTNTLHSKLHKLKICKTLQRTKLGLLALRSTLLCRIAQKLRDLIKRYSINRRNLYHPHHHQQLRKGFAAIYVDELFPEPGSRQAKNPISSEKAGEAKYVAASSSSASISTRTSAAAAAAHAWKTSVSQLPQLRGIDERADEFISKFREEMMLQREQSLLDFQEMLARSS